MKQKEFIEQFEKLKEQYEQNQRNVVDALKALVLKYYSCDEKQSFCAMSQTTVNDISSNASYEDLYKIYNEICHDYYGRIRASKNSADRENNMRRNQYGPDNQYPNF